MSQPLALLPDQVTGQREDKDAVAPVPVYPPDLHCAAGPVPRSGEGEEDQERREDEIRLPGSPIVLEQLVLHVMESSEEGA